MMMYTLHCTYWYKLL